MFISRVYFKSIKMPCRICHVSGHNRITCPQNTEPGILLCENEVILCGDELEDYNIFMNLSHFMGLGQTLLERS